MGPSPEREQRDDPVVNLAVEPSLTNAQTEALARALRVEALDGAGRPSGLDCAWRRAGLLEAVDRTPGALPRPSV